jgi:hypothetical protein
LAERGWVADQPQPWPCAAAGVVRTAALRNFLQDAAMPCSKSGGALPFPAQSMTRWAAQWLYTQWPPVFSNNFGPTPKPAFCGAAIPGFRPHPAFGGVRKFGFHGIQTPGEAPELGFCGIQTSGESGNLDSAESGLWGSLFSWIPPNLPQYGTFFKRKPPCPGFWRVFFPGHGRAQVF